MRYIFLVLIGLSINSHANSQGGSIVTVGSTPNCDFSDIQSAINSNPDEVRVTEANYEENLFIFNQDLIINGAFLDCDSAASGNENGFRSFVEGVAPILPVIRITDDNQRVGGGQRHHVIIKNMSFSNGSGSQELPGGGLITLQINLQLTLENLSFFDNTGISGGAIAVIGGDTDVQAKDLQITNNNANEGGGIYCSGNNNSFILQASDNPDMGIYTNEATNGDGGGVLVSQGCEFTSYLGSDLSDTSLDSRGINLNSASGKGGGVAVENGAKLYLKGHQECGLNTCLGNNQYAVTIADNQSGNFGGGISAKGENSLVEAYAFNIYGNTAISGAGVSVEQGAKLATNYLMSNCWSPGSCNQINNNRASATGGAIYGQSGADIFIAKTFLTRNRADLAVVASIWGNAILELDSSVVAFNANLGTGGFNDEHLFNIFSGGVLNVKFSTITRNRVLSEMIRNGGTQINLSGSIIYGPGLDIYFSVPSGSLNAECLVLNEEFTVNGSNLLVGDPNFIAPVTGDFHLALDSIAIDLCAPDLMVTSDMDLTVRGFDVSNVPNTDGTYDAGAYEARPDLIFADGFE